MPRDRYDDDDDRPRRRRDEDDDRPRRRRDDDDDDDRPRRSRRRDDDDFDRPAESSGNGMAVASLILGLVSLFFGPITGLIGGILGIVALRKPTGKGLAIAGMLLSFVFSVAWVGVVVWSYLDFQSRKKESINYKILGIATHSYSDSMGYLPKPYHDEQFGFNNPNPNQDLSNKLSWRVSLLPYIEQSNIYSQLNLKENWDSATNRPHADRPIPYYSDVETPADPTTRFRCFYDNGAVFDTKQRITMMSIFDGTSNTILYVEGGDKVTWSRFQEYKYDPKAPLPALGKPNKSTFGVLMADGSYRTMRKNMNEQTLRNLITRADGMVVDFDGR